MKLPFENKKFTLLFIAAIIVVILEIAAQLGWEIPFPYSAIIYAAFVLGFGYQIIISGFKNLFKLKFGSVSLLMLVAVAGAFYLGEYSEGAVVMVLYVLGETLEDVGVDNSKSALENLVNKAPRVAYIKDIAEPVQIDKIQIGSIVKIKPGELIPMDGKIVTGASSIDESAITGEPIAKNKTLGDLVFAGTLNNEGYIEIETTKLSADTTFSKIIKLTFQATANKSEKQKFIQKFAKKYTPAILILAVICFFVSAFILHHEWKEALNQAISLLVIGCPCALVISTPVSIYAAIGNASSQGAIIKGGKFLEELAEIKALALDKTRTITVGQPVVSDIIMLNGTSKEELLACTAGAEQFSEHPVAQAIVFASEKEGFQPHQAHKYKSISGKGAMAECLICKDETITAGTLDFVGEKEKIQQEEKDIVTKLSHEGKTSVVVSFGKGVAGILGLVDEIKGDSAAAIHELKKIGVEPIMLTGDNQFAGNYIGQKAGIDKVYGNLLPEGKSKKIEELQQQFGAVAMVGDGINDAPALAKSNVGIAMGAAGSDVAIETANVALMNDKLSLIPFIIRLGRATVKQIRVNTYGAIIVKVLVAILAFSGYSSLVLAILADVGVMIVVILLSLRLRSFK